MKNLFMFWFGIALMVVSIYAGCYFKYEIYPTSETWEWYECANAIILGVFSSVAFGTGFVVSAVAFFDSVTLENNDPW